MQLKRVVLLSDLSTRTCVRAFKHNLKKNQFKLDSTLMYLFSRQDRMVGSH